MFTGIVHFAGCIVFLSEYNLTESLPCYSYDDMMKT